VLPNQALKPTAPACGGHVGLALSVTPSFFRYSPAFLICDTYGFVGGLEIAALLEIRSFETKCKMHLWERTLSF